jgi:hypothetical protein
LRLALRFATVVDDSEREVSLQVRGIAVAMELMVLSLCSSALSHNWNEIR